MALQEQALPLPGVAPDRTGKYRTDPSRPSLMHFTMRPIAIPFLVP